MIPIFRAWDKRRKAFRNDIFINSEGCIYEFSKNTGYGKAISFVNDEYIELMQSTGLKDKNGKEIFEGDIVIDGFFEDCCVVKIGEYVIEHKGDYDNDFVTKVFGPFLESDDGFKISDISDFKEARVVGNIFEDGDLIDG